MEFTVKAMLGNDDAGVIAQAIRTVDPDAEVDVNLDAKTVEVESWLISDEFLIAFEEAGYDVRITAD
jgi:copper chaperone